MDMYASLNGKKDNVLLLDCKSITHEYFPLVLSGYKIVLLNSKVHHSLAGSEYNVRRQWCEEGLEILKQQMNISSFRDIKDAGELQKCESIMKPAVYNCCKYVVEEILRTKKAGELLQQNNLPAFGKLMFDTHEGLSNLYQVSCTELDFLAAQAKLSANVIGARLMGGGFGGCTINIVKEEAVTDFIKKISSAYKSKFAIEPEAYVVAIGDGTYQVNNFSATATLSSLPTSTS